MVDFRYHLVSIIAIFLALAVGIVLGTTTLNAPIADNLRDQVNSLRGDNHDLRSSVTNLQAQVADEQKFAAEVTPLLVGGRLSGQRIAVVIAPGVPASLRNAVVDTLRQAAADVTAEVKLTEGYLDPQRSTELGTLVDSLTTTTGDTPTGDASTRAGALLASAVVAGPTGRQPPATATAELLRRFEDAGMATVEGRLVDPGGLAILLVPPAPKTKGDAAGYAVNALLALAGQLDRRGSGAVVTAAGPGDVTTGALSLARADDRLSADVSTVDSVETPTGRVELVFALVEQANGEAGAYGSGPGASEPLPTPSP